jgi:hypothetical protein
MNGQWIGTYSGTNSGLLVADLDDVGASYQGVVSVYDSNPASPKMVAHINNIPKDKARFSLPATRLEQVFLGLVDAGNFWPAFSDWIPVVRMFAPL